MESATKKLTVRIEWNEKHAPSKGYSIISEPWSFTVQFNEVKTALFEESKQFGSHTALLNTWCQRIVEMQYPLYKGEVTNIKVI